MSAAHVAMAHGAGGSWRMDNASPAGPCLVRLLSATRAATCARLTSFASAFDLDSNWIRVARSGGSCRNLAMTNCGTMHELPK